MKKTVRLTESELIKLVKRVIEEQGVPSDPVIDEYIVKKYLDRGYKIVNELSLPDGEYDVSGSGSVLHLSKDGKETGYCVISTSGIRGPWQNTKVTVTNKTVQLPNIISRGKVYRILFKELQ